jgi:hypothetical protein
VCVKLSPNICICYPRYSPSPSLGYSPPFTPSSLPSCLPWENINRQPEYHWVKCYNDNPCVCRPFCDHVFYPWRPLAPLLEVWTQRWLLYAPASISVIVAVCANLVVRLRSVNTFDLLRFATWCMYSCCAMLRLYEIWSMMLFFFALGGIRTRCNCAISLLTHFMNMLMPSRVWWSIFLF